LGQKVCRTFVKHTLGANSQTINNIKESLEHGMVDYPRMPIKMLSASSEQLHKADAWFQYFYWNYAEPYANGSEDIIDTENIMEEAVVSSDHPLWSMAIGAREGSKRKAPVKFVDTVTLEHIFDLHIMTTLEDRVSRSTLQRAWTKTWKQLIKILPTRTHARCNTCAELDEHKKRATTEDERLRYQEEKYNHIKDIKTYRVISMRGNRRSDEAVVHPNTDGHQQ
jgi:hypothetical protein